jgi:dTDP-4-dehydrorhamnose reductase
VLRTTTVYGPDPQEKNYLYTLSRVIKAGNTMLAPTDQLATPTYNADLAAASIALVARNQTGIFHVAGPDFLSRYDFAVAASKILALSTATLQPVTTPELAQAACRPLLGGLAITRLQSILGGDCMRTVETGIRDWEASLGTAS